ncbi:MAG TPA: DNA adenine methylase [Polyangiaceae bacterium]|nr:DNA adenine methylase [Polyangiaceae bacterium]
MVAAATLMPSDFEAKPFVKWVGGKRQLLPSIAEIVTPRLKAGAMYHEPFIGGGAVFFHLQPKRAVLTDSNERLIRTYRAIKKDVAGVIRRLRSFPHDKDFYLETRAKNIDAEDDVDVAAWFIYLNRTGYNGLYRVNSRNVFNVPFGDYTNPTICDVDNLRACSRALKGARIEKRDFEGVLSRAQRGDFVYFDPPYVPLTATSRFTDYTSDGFSDADQVRLRDVALELKKRGVSVLLSNSSAQRVYDLYGDRFEIREALARRSVNSNPTGRGRIPELLIY